MCNHNRPEKVIKDATESGSKDYTFIFLCVTYFPESDDVLYIANLIAVN